MASARSSWVAPGGRSTWRWRTPTARQAAFWLRRYTLQPWSSRTVTTARQGWMARSCSARTRSASCARRASETLLPSMVRAAMGAGRW